MNKWTITAAVIAGVTGIVVVLYFTVAFVVDKWDDWDKDVTIAKIERESTEAAAPTPLPVRVTVDPNNGFVCYDNTSSIACFPMMWSVPPPDVSAYIQGRIGHVFDFRATPIPTPLPYPLDGIN